MCSDQWSAYILSWLQRLTAYFSKSSDARIALFSILESVCNMSAFDLRDAVYYSNVVMVAAAVLTYCGLTFLAAPYGKSSTGGWGVLVPAQVAWMVMESPNLWITALVYANRHVFTGNAIANDANKVTLFCFLLHYINRSIIYPLRMRSSHCTPMPISVMGAAFIFCSWNGLNQSLSLILFDDNSDTKLTDVRFIAGVAIFFTGFFINVQSDSILINAKRKPNVAKSSKYVIPTGGMFRFVSCANYCKLKLKALYCKARIFHAVLVLALTVLSYIFHSRFASSIYSW